MGERLSETCWADSKINKIVIVASSWSFILFTYTDDALSNTNQNFLGLCVKWSIFFLVYNTRLRRKSGEEWNKGIITWLFWIKLEEKIKPSFVSIFLWPIFLFHICISQVFSSGFVYIYKPLENTRHSSHCLFNLNLYRYLHRNSTHTNPLCRYLSVIKTFGSKKTN